MKKYLVIIAVIVLVNWWFTDPTIDVNDLSFSYIVKYSGNANEDDMLPMVVALHGNGDTTQNFYETALDKINAPARIILLEGPMPHSKGSAWPWSADDFMLYGKAINDAIESLTFKFPTKQKPILLGFSGGGMMAYYQAIKHGNSYSYIFPVSGRLSKELLGDGSISLGAKVFAFHGKSDGVVSINGGRNAVNILKKNGAFANFVEFDGGHHGIFNQMKSEISDLVNKKIVSLN